MRPVLFFALLAPGVAQAGATLYPAGTYFATIQQAVDAATPAAGDTVVVDPGVHVEDLVIDVDVTIEGAGIGVTTIQGAGATNVIQIDGGPVTIQGLTIDGAGNRGMSATSDPLVSLQTVEFVGTATTDFGASIDFSNTPLDLVDVVFVGGTALDGGAIALTSTSDLTATGVDFIGSVASNNGGAVHVANSSFFCDGCDFATTSAASGGAVYGGGSADITIVNSSFSDNVAAGGPGGGLALNGAGSAVVEDISATIGSTTTAGGFLHAVGMTGSLEVRRASICGFTASFDGGAIYVTDGDLLLRNAVITDNTGTAAVAVQNGMLDAVNNHFLSNDGTNAIDVSSGTFDLRNNLIAYNNNGVLTLGSTGTYDYNAFFGNSIGDYAVLAPAANDLQGQDPLLWIFSDDGDCTNDVPTPHIDSPLVDAGDPTVANDLDGSVSDIGAFSGPDSDPGLWLDDDGDLHPVLFDCDDADVLAFQGNVELCDDGIDNDCNGLTDEAASPYAVYWFVDADGDGYGDSSDFGILSCPGSAPYGSVDNSQDCDDTDPGVSPDADEICFDAIDSNCDGDPDLNAVNAVDFFLDADGDGYGDDATVVSACTNPGGYVTLGGDCDETNTSINPGEPDDTCDGVDNDCSGDESNAPGWVDWWDDLDGDGYGAPYTGDGGCTQPANTATNPDDCFDGDATISPGMAEICDGLDNDCNGVVDDGTPLSSWFDDRDGDGWGDVTTETIAFCPPAPRWVSESGDCDDQEPAVYPTADEVCDGLDNDCNGQVDLDDAGITDAKTGYRDHDGDGYGADEQVTSCDDDIVDVDGDCQPLDPKVNPDAEEVPGNGVDEDCDGEAQGYDPGETPGPAGCACSSSSPAPGSMFLVPLVLAIAGRRRSCQRLVR